MNIHCIPCEVLIRKDARPSEVLTLKDARDLLIELDERLGAVSSTSNICRHVVGKHLRTAFETLPFYISKGLRLDTSECQRLENRFS